jgi:hypothetical protein
VPTPAQPAEVAFGCVKSETWVTLVPQVRVTGGPSANSISALYARESVIRDSSARSESRLKRSSSVLLVVVVTNATTT